MGNQKTDAQEVAAIAVVVAQALRGGATVYKALESALERANSRLANLLRHELQRAALGTPLAKVFREAALSTKSQPLEEFLHKLELAGQTGSALADQLDQLVFTLQEQVASEQLAKAAKRETRMLLPLVFLVLPVTVLFALYPSLQILNLQMEGA